jgi:hypothetical protein
LVARFDDVVPGAGADGRGESDVGDLGRMPGVGGGEALLGDDRALVT